MRRCVKIGLGCLLLLYVGSYALLSRRGQYVPGATGTNGVKHYMWAPKGFVSGPFGMKHNEHLQSAYFPLWLLDIRFAHTYDKAMEGTYPVNTAYSDAYWKRMAALKAAEAKTETPPVVDELDPSSTTDASSQ